MIKTINKFLIAALAIFSMTASAPLLVHADGVVDSSNCPAGSSICKDANSAPGSDNSALFGSDGIVTKITRLIALAAGIASAFIMVYAGLTYVTSSGDSKKINTAKTTILYAAIGLVIALIAQSIVSFIMVNIK